MDAYDDVSLVSCMTLSNVVGLVIQKRFWTAFTLAHTDRHVVCTAVVRATYLGNADGPRWSRMFRPPVSRLPRRGWLPNDDSLIRTVVSAKLLYLYGAD